MTDSARETEILARIASLEAANAAATGWGAAVGARCAEISALKNELRAMKATPPLPDREEIARAVRVYCRSLGAAAIQTSPDGVERIYFAGVPVNGIADAILALREPGEGVGS